MLVSAAIADGPPRRLLEVISEGAAELALVRPVVGEFRRVLVEKLDVDPGQVEYVESLLTELSGPIGGVPDDVPAVSGDPDDDRILAAGTEAGADVLVTGDTRHLLPLGEHRGMRILRPQDLLAQLLG